MTAPLSTNKHIQVNLIEMTKEKLLLERITLNGVNVNIRNKKGENALYWAIKKGTTHNTNLLIAFESSLMVTKNRHALFHAIESKHYEAVILLIKLGINVNIRDKNEKTPLIYAIEENMFNAVMFLIRAGADIYLLDDKLNMAEDYAKKSTSSIQEYFKHIVCTDMNSLKKCKCE